MEEFLDRLKRTTYYLFKKGKTATWIFGVTLIVVGFPLVLEIEREQQLVELEKQQNLPPSQSSGGSGGLTPPGPAMTPIS